MWKIRKFSLQLGLEFMTARMIDEVIPMAKEEVFCAHIIEKI